MTTTGEAAEGFGARIRKARGELTLQGFAEALGVHKNTLARYERGESSPDGELLALIARKFSINPRWLLTGEGRMRGGGEEEEKSGFVYLPLYNVTASGGGGSFLEGEEVADTLAFRREWVTGVLRANPSDLALITMTGESMEPTLGKDDVLLVNLALAKNPRDGIHLIRSGSALLVKRLQFTPDGRVSVLSDNCSYPPFAVDPNDAETAFKILGRIVWAGRKV